MPRLLMTVGLPRSGKTTWARATTFPIVSPDAIRLALHGQVYIGQAEPFVWAIAKLMVRALFAAGHDTVVLDACNVTRERRAEWKSRDWTRIFHVFSADAARCLERAKADGRPELESVILRMAHNFEPITVEEWAEMPPFEPRVTHSLACDVLANREG